MHKLFTYILFCTTALLVAQQTRVTGAIGTIHTDNGLHKIQIPPLVRSYASEDIHDFRILNKKGEQVPYFVHHDALETQVSDFIAFEIVSKNQISDSSTTYVFKNRRNKLKKVIVSIANYEGNKSISLEGSNDQKQWFGLMNNKILYSLKSTTQTSVYKVLDFPLNSYRYIKIVFDDRHTLPVNLLKIGEAKTTIQKTKLTTIPAYKLITTELPKEHKTQLHIRFEHPELVHQIRFEVSAPEFYNRNLTLYAIGTRTVRNTLETYQKHIADFRLRSDSTQQFSVQQLFEKEFYITIDNQDNPKLQIREVTFFQNPLFVIADLKKGEEYRIIAGDKKLKAPNYDLSYFKSHITPNVPTALIRNMAYSTPDLVTETKANSFWQQSWFMWSCIGLAGILIAYFASSLIKDLNTNA